MTRRRAFTLVEMMVSMALVLFIMVILATAFSAGLESFRRLKATGDMVERLRAATTVLRRDLAADHFESRRRLSDANFALAGTPREGFFRIVQGNPSVAEGADGDGNASYRATDHVLHFSVRLRGNRRESFFQAAVPAGSPLLPGSNPYAATTFFDQPPDARFQDGTATYASPWAEVAYFLAATGTTDNPADPAAASGTPLFTLYRSQFVVVPDNSHLSLTIGAFGGYLEMCAQQLPNKPTVMFFNTPGDMVSPDVDSSTQIVHRAFTSRGTPFNPATPAQWAATPLLTDVLGFCVRVLRVGGPDFGDLDPDAAGRLVFDTGATPPPAYGIAALEITLRVWDAKTEQARQVTLIQDL